jgi:Type IV secretion system pilin
MNAIETIATGIINFINNIAVPLIFAFAFIFFLWGVFKYFIAGGDNPAEVEKGKTFIVYGLLGFFIMISLWGLVRILVGTFGFENTQRPCLPTFSGKGNCPPAQTTTAPSGAITPGGRMDPSSPNFVGPRE